MGPVSVDVLAFDVLANIIISSAVCSWVTAVAACMEVAT